MKPRKFNFNMIEVMVALAIIIIVVVSVLSLLPSAMRSNQEAINRMAATDSGQQFLEFFSSRLEQRWDDLVAFPDAKTDITDESKHAFSTYGMLRESRLQVHYEAPNESDPWVPTVSNTGLFRVKFVSNGGNVDFDGYIRAWKEATDMASGDASPRHVRLQCEISWPASLPYEERRKHTMSLQVYKPGALELEASAINSAPCLSTWGIEGATTSPALYRYTFSEEATTFSFKEGDIKGLEGCQVEAIAVAANGSIFFINTHSSEPACVLYKISRGSIDGKTGTDVHVSRVGSTGVSNSAGRRLTCLQFANDKLYAIGESTQDVYEIDYTTAVTQKVGDLGVGGTFVAGGMSVAADKFVYVTRALATKSELWRFQKFPEGPIYQVDTLIKSGSIRSIAAHPGGWIFLYDGTTCYRYEPITGLTQSVLNFTSNVSDMDFYYIHERDDCENIRACETDGNLTGEISLNPSGNSDFDFIMTTVTGQKISRDDLMSLGSKWEYDGKIYRIEFKPKATGQQDVTVDGDPYELDNSVGYVLSSDVPFGVHVYNDNATGTAMGHWLADLTDAPVHINFCGDTGDSSITGTGGESVGLYTITSGAIEVQKNSTVTVKVISTSYETAKGHLPLTLALNVDGKGYTPFGDPSDPVAGNINDGKLRIFTVPTTVPAKGLIAMTGTSFDSWAKVLMTASSSPSTAQVQLYAQDPNTVRVEFELESTSAAKMTWQSIVLTVTIVPN